MLEENKNLEKEIKLKGPSKIGNIIFWIGIIILEIGVIIGSIIAAGPSPEMGMAGLFGMIVMAIVGIPGLILTLIGLFVKERVKPKEGRLKRVVFTILILIGGTIFLSIAGVNFIDWFEAFAVQSNNEFFCGFIYFDNWTRDHCYFNAAQDKNDFTICNKLREKKDTYFCYAKVAEIKDDSSVCEQIPASGKTSNISSTFSNEIYNETTQRTGIFPERTIDIKDYCYRTIAVSQKNPELCEKIIGSPQQKDNCYYDLANNSRDSSFCQKILDQSKNNDCYFGIQGSVPYLGVYSVLINEEVKNYFKLQVEQGALVEVDPTSGKPAVEPGSPADKAGIIRGDIILEINGIEINASNSVAGVIRSYKAGDELVLKIFRDGKEIEKKVILEELRESANWSIYHFSLEEIKKRLWTFVDPLGRKHQEEAERIIKEREIEACDFEIKYPSQWDVELYPSGGIFPEKLSFGESNGCIFAMSLNVDPEEEKYCFPVSFYNGKSDPNRCNRIFQEMLSTFRFIEKKITVTSPTEGEVWKVGETYQIRWTPTDPEERVVMRLYKAPYLSLDLVWEPSYGLPNTGTYSFTVFDWLEPVGRYQFQIFVYGGSGESSYSYKGRSGEFSIISE